MVKCIDFINLDRLSMVIHLRAQKCCAERTEFLKKILSNPTISKGTIGYQMKAPFKTLAKIKEIEGNEKWGGYLDEFGIDCMSHAI